jgi:hypothetical protein
MVINELFQAEKTYVDGLKRMNDFWKSSFLKSGIFKTNEVEDIFYSVPFLIQLYDAFLKDLESINPTEPSLDTEIGKLFLKNLQFIAQVDKFIAAFTANQHLISSTLSDPSNKKNLIKSEIQIFIIKPKNLVLFLLHQFKEVLFIYF